MFACTVVLCSRSDGGMRRMKNRQCLVAVVVEDDLGRWWTSCSEGASVDAGQLLTAARVRLAGHAGQ